MTIAAGRALRFRLGISFVTEPAEVIRYVAFIYTRGYPYSDIGMRATVHNGKLGLMLK